MTLLGFRAQNHAQQVSTRGALNNVDDRETDPRIWDEWNARFGGFSIDVAADHHNAKTPRYYTLENDGLYQPWRGETVWCNPPFSDIRPWIEKAWREWEQVHRPELIVMLLPANRTEQGWWQDLVEARRDRVDSPLRVEFLRGRLRFLEPGEQQIRPNSRPPFGCCLLIWSAS